MVKSQKSIVDMLVVDMRRCGKYKDTHKNFHYTLASFGEELLHAKEWTWRASHAQHKHRIASGIVSGDLGLVFYYQARPEDRLDIGTVRVSFAPLWLSLAPIPGAVGPSTPSRTASRQW